MDVFYVYTYSSSAWIALQGTALVFTPKLILMMLSEDPSTPSDLEIYFSRTSGFALITIALMTIILSGSIPLTSTVVNPVSVDNQDDPKAPYAMPAILLTALFHTTCAVYAYSWHVYRSNIALAMGSIGSGIAASIGLWCLLFGGSKGRLSRRTGADKRTAGFPLKNPNAYRRFPEKNK